MSKNLHKFFITLTGTINGFDRLVKIKFAEKIGCSKGGGADRGS